jgi:NitT/TauT family transport system substrate-binding protein
MKSMLLFRFLLPIGAALCMHGLARAELSEVTIAKQHGISYLPFMVMERDKLLEKHARAVGLGDIKVNWHTFAGGGATNDALISGNLHFASAGVPPFATLWEKTKGNLNVKAVCAMSSLPSYLNTRNPAVKSISDLGDADRIALPAVKISNQAIYLQMAAAKAFGIENYNKFDKLTVTMSFVDGTTSLLSGTSEVNTHFVSPPFAQQQLEKPGIRNILNSYEVMGGPATLIVVYTTEKIQKTNPKTYAAFVAAFGEAINAINRDKPAAAAFYVKETKSKDSVESVEKILNDTQVEFTMTPRRISTYTDFMAKVGSLKTKPASWKEMFFPNAHGLPGS